MSAVSPIRRGAGWADTVQAGHGAAVLGDELAQLLVGRSDLRVDRGELEINGRGYWWRPL
jgi:hypothetical protein